jgi:hypothetical protein
MKIKMLITALLIGTSTMASVAVAQPVYRNDSSYHRRHDDGRWNRGRANRVPRGYNDRGYNNDLRYNNGQWVTLVAPVPTVRDRQFITIGPEQGRFDRVRLDMVRGDAFIQQIAVEYMNGRTQVVPINRRVDRRDGSVVIPLDGSERAIKRVIVYTDDRSRGAYTLMAQ